MASKTKKAGSVAPQPPPVSSTPQPSGRQTPSSAARSRSPLSPTRHSRLAEKADLQNLNDRLATYIDKVRSLESENARLTMEVQTSQESVTREVSNIKQMYEAELGDARRLLDETAREKAKLEIDTKRLWEQLQELQERADKKAKDCAIAENSARLYESRYTELSGKYNQACSERKKALEDLKDLEKELEKTRKNLDDLRKHLESETLSRIDLENNIQSLTEELTFKDQVHAQELTETRSRRQVEISEIDGRLSEQYEAKLQQSLQELRDQYESQMRANRDEIEQLYENKIQALQNAAQRANNSASMQAEEMRTTRMRLEGLNSKIAELEGLNAQLQIRARELEKLLDAERSRYSDERAMLDAELNRLRDEMALQLQEYQDLMDIKVSLDLEIAAYDKLLKGEENRLNITPSNTANASQLSMSFRSGSGRATPIARRGTPTRAGTKRRRTVLEESEERSISDFSVTSSAKGDIEIIEADPEGKFVKLHNKGSKDVAIGGWQLVRVAGVNETQFKFHRSVKVEPNGVVTVWSADLGVNHEPPTTIVMKNQKWFCADTMKTQLFNGDGEEVAASERTRQQISSHASRHRELGFGNEDLYHQQGDPESNNEKCFIM